MTGGEDPMAVLVRRLQHLGRSLVRHLPEQPYPSDHPWSTHHDPRATSGLIRRPVHGNVRGSRRSLARITRRSHTSVPLCAG